MNVSRWLWSLSVAVLVACLAAGGLTAQQGNGGAGRTTFDGFTRPSLEVTVGSRVEGLVADVPAKEGQVVRKGDLLVRLDNTVEKIEVELSRMQAEADKNIEAMGLIAKQKEADLQRAKVLLERGGITGVEYEQAELQVKVARLNIEIAQNRRKAAELQYQRDLARLAQREIRAPIDGVVTRLMKDPGEAVERLETVAEVVQLDPLEVVLNVPVSTRGQFKANQAARVKMARGDTWHKATVKMVDPVVDFASNTYRVKVVLPNPNGKHQAGVRVTVDLR